MWTTVKLGEACLVRRGTTITKKQTVEGEVPVIGGGTKPTYFHNEPNRDANCITVSGSGASAGFVNKWEVPIFASDCSTVEPKDETQLPQFIYYYLMSQQQFIYDNFRSGAAQPHVYARDLETLDYPIIPLAEQQRIVTKLNAAFAEIDRAIKLAEAKEAEVDSLKASLISSLLAGEGMTASTLGETCRMYQPKTISTKEMVADGDYVVFGANGIIGRYDKYNHEHEQLLVTCRGATCGAVNISHPKSWITGNAMVIQPDVAIVSMRYMEYVFRGGIDLSKAIAGSAQPQITRKSLEPIAFSYPSLKEQERVVETLDVASQKLKKSVEHIRTILANYNALKAAILAQELQPSEAA